MTVSGVAQNQLIAFRVLDSLTFSNLLIDEDARHGKHNYNFNGRIGTVKLGSFSTRISSTRLRFFFRRYIHTPARLQSAV